MKNASVVGGRSVGGSPTPPPAVPARHTPGIPAEPAGGSAPEATARRVGPDGTTVSRGAPGAAVDGPGGGADRRTRYKVAQYLLERGASTAVELGAALGLSSAAIRRHLDAMLAEGMVQQCQRRERGPRGRGRPAKTFVLTDAARERLHPHAYDGIATAALRWIAERGGPEAVTAFAAAQVAALEDRCRAELREAGRDPLGRAEALAKALTAEGYVASASAIASGGQLCQHHCPVAHVAAEFPQLCEAETEVISRLVGTHVQRLATIAHGDGVCTTYIPGLRRGAAGCGPRAGAAGRGVLAGQGTPIPYGPQARYGTEKSTATTVRTDR